VVNQAQNETEAKMINFRNGMAVVTSLGEQVGHVKNLVVTPDVGQVSHLIIGRGFLFTEDKVMPANWISHNDGDRLILNADQVKFHRA
jgi:sporulation protein YlmC with PRC-barrel domain